jgi:hypothetical protein
MKTMVVPVRKLVTTLTPLYLLFLILLLQGCKKEEEKVAANVAQQVRKVAVVIHTIRHLPRQQRSILLIATAILSIPLSLWPDKRQMRPLQSPTLIALEAATAHLPVPM